MRIFATLSFLVHLCPGQESLPETIVLADRLVEEQKSVARWDGEGILEFSPRSIDELLASDPSFSLFRRQPSTLSNPTAAGVSLRNTGATAASRTLVLRDGIPQNDPFGGWINWTRYQPATLASAAIVPAAESAVWGNLSPAGSLRLQRRSALEGGSLLQFTGGSQDTIAGSLSHSSVSESGHLGVGLDVFGFHTNGFHAVPAWQRGTIDEPLDLEYAGADLRFVWKALDHLTIEPTFSYYDERRGNGTPATGNTTEAEDLSVRVTADLGDSSWQALAYYQRRRFSSIFSAVDPLRSDERIALNQFRVPGEGLGGAFVHRSLPTEAVELTTGVDFRLLSGETQENAGTFRRRRAGGDQAFGGLFTSLAWDGSDSTRVDLSAADLITGLFRMASGSRTPSPAATPSAKTLFRTEVAGSPRHRSPSVNSSMSH